jgi:hypothetical protein
VVPSPSGSSNPRRAEKTFRWQWQSQGFPRHSTTSTVWYKQMSSIPLTAGCSHANGRAHFFSLLTAKTKALRPFETSLFTHWQRVTFPSSWNFVYDLRFLKFPVPSLLTPNTILYCTVSYFFQIYVSTFRLLWCHSKQRISLYVFLSSSLTCEVEDVPFYVLLWFFIRDEVLYTNCRSACYTLGVQNKTRKQEHKHKIEWEGFLLLTKTEKKIPLKWAHDLDFLFPQVLQILS